MTGSNQQTGVNSNRCNVSNKSLPKDAHVIISILKELGVKEYEPKVINQLLDFTYRYVAGVLEDARLYANHAKKKQIDIEDVRLAVQLQMDKIFTSPPPRDLLLEIARACNSVPLPPIKPHCGIRLPPDRYCLTSSNMRLKGLRKVSLNTEAMKPSYQTSLGGNLRHVVGSPAVSFVKQGGTSVAIPTSALNSTAIQESLNTSKPKIITMSKPSSVNHMAPTNPVIRVTPGKEIKQIVIYLRILGHVSVTPKIQVTPASCVPLAQSSSNINLTIKTNSNDENRISATKRKHDDDDYYNG